jgi:hypothetical protein
MQGDGNLVLLQAGMAVWDAGTYSQNCGTDQCQADLDELGIINC